MSFAAATLEPWALFVPPFDQSVSQDGANLRESIDDTLGYDTSMLGRRTDAVLARVLRALEKAATSEAAVQASSDALERAVALLWTLPDRIPLPEIVVESDGEVAFDWDEGARRVLSVSIGQGSMLKYAALLGSEPIHGRVAFAGSLPVTLSFLLDRLYAGAAGDRPN